MTKNLVSHFYCLCLDSCKIQNLQQFDNQGSRSELCWILKWTQKPCSTETYVHSEIPATKKAQKGGDPQQQQQQADVGWHAFKHISSEENGQQQL